MWTSENRPRYNRDKLRYPSDLTDEEWAHIEPLIPRVVATHFQAENHGVVQDPRVQIVYDDARHYATLVVDFFK